jgi:acyl-CoA thioesterase I
MIGSATKQLLVKCAGIYGGARGFVHAQTLRPFLLALTLAMNACAFTAAEAAPQKIVAFGDSLTAGYLLPASAAFPAQLERRLRADGFDAAVVNAGVSGETTGDGLARAAFTLEGGADLVILELGANDMLRGLDPTIPAANLEKLIAESQKRGAPVLLAGMLASGNYGAEYKSRFDAIFPALATRFSLPFYPFFLEGVAGVAGMTLPDGLHPSEQGVARIVGGVAPLVEKLLAEKRASGGAPPAR